MKYIKITVEDLANLLRDSIILNALNNGGVDNWGWYGECFSEDIENALDEDNEDLVESKGYIIQDE